MKQFRNMLYPYVVWLFIMVLVPMLMILLYAFTTAGNEVTTFRFTLENFSRFLTDTVFLDVLKRSLLIAVVTTVVCVLLGYPIAYTIAKNEAITEKMGLNEGDMVLIIPSTDMQAYYVICKVVAANG